MVSTLSAQTTRVSTQKSRVKGDMENADVSRVSYRLLRRSVPGRLTGGYACIFCYNPDVQNGDVLCPRRKSENSLKIKDRQLIIRGVGVGRHFHFFFCCGFVGFPKTH